MAVSRDAVEVEEAGAEVLSDGITIDSGIAENVPRYRRLVSHWRGTGEVKGLDGEFRLPYFYRALSNEAPRVWDGAPEEEVRLFEDFRIIDGAPRSGIGTFVAIRLSPDVNSPELWVYDPRIGPLELDYLGYLEALSLTKGVHGWQYLYADVKLGGSMNSWSRSCGAAGVNSDRCALHGLWARGGSCGVGIVSAAGVGGSRV
ncbi:hypothetical protein [Actinomadura rifamycini]|uniref:hypothetical protein n=1 Tax=Actinomadura rifamycini TaxID=31962 RepID=UPI0012F7AF5F|nr:hypothetical protein [Actinomadura rifamycini]